MCKVSIIVLTYNQENTIKRTLDSIINQETTYDYEIIIGEDASTDGTRKVCEDFISQNQDIVVKLTDVSTNLGVVSNYVNCISYCSGEYLMQCAGDDWWNNLNKIQIQVDYMDSHPECVLLHSGYNIFYPSKNITTSVLPNKKSSTLDFIKKNSICAPTICARMSAINSVNFEEFIKQNFCVEDFPLWIELSKRGEVHSIDDLLVTYSVCLGSLEHSADYKKKVDYLNRIHDIRLFFIEKFNIPISNKYIYISSAQSLGHVQLFVTP